MTIVEAIEEAARIHDDAIRDLLTQYRREMALLKMDYLPELIEEGWLPCPDWYYPAWYSPERNGFDFRKPSPNSR